MRNAFYNEYLPQHRHAHFNRQVESFKADSEGRRKMTMVLDHAIKMGKQQEGKRTDQKLRTYLLNSTESGLHKRRASFESDLS